MEYVVEETFAEHKCNALVYGKSNRSNNGETQNIGKSGVAIRAGAGLFEQMSYGNYQTYNEFDLNLLEDILLQISTSVLGFGERNFVIDVGEYGMRMISRAIKDYASAWIPTNYGSVNNPALIKQVKSELHTNALGGGAQFTEWTFANNINIKFNINHMKDDMVQNKIMSPWGGPAQSYRMDIWYIGNTEQSNIKIAKVKGQEDYRGYTWGPFRNPFTGATGNPYASFDEDAAVIHRMATLGVIIFDPGRVMTLLPEVLG